MEMKRVKLFWFENSNRLGNSNLFKLYYGVRTLTSCFGMSEMDF